MMELRPSRALFVAWQHPDSRRYFPVARLATCASGTALLYEFAYIQGALEAASVGFQPFLAFPDFRQVYRSDRLFPLFCNRLMPRNRGDFPEYMDRLGLTIDADDLEILSRSSGVRATDSLEMFPLPMFDPQVGCFQTYFWMHGFRHLDPVSQHRVGQLKPNDQLLPTPEPTNSADPNAIQLFTKDGTFVGYVPRYLASDASHLLKECASFEIYVVKVNADPAPPRQRLLCNLLSCWPENFVPCDSTTYQAIASSAWKVNPCTTEVVER